MNREMKNKQVLTGKKVSKFFGGVAALRNVDFHVLQNEILGLIGPNGAGKTTLFNVIACVLKPDQGIIEFNNLSILDLNPHSICRRGIARTYQIPKPFLQMSVLENVMVGARFGTTVNRNFKRCQEEAERILSLVGLAAKRKSLASQLTLVERKRLELARALSTEPQVLMLDEVIGGLNPTETVEMVELIRGIHGKGITIIMIEHVMKAVMGLSDRIIVLNYGEKIADGSPQEVTNNKAVITAYLGGSQLA
jgi:branched-chain amino acid transport system ATP-binding protein